MKLLIIGTMPPPLGGTTISLSHLVNALNRRPDVHFHVVNTSDIRGLGYKGGFKLLGVFFEILRKALWADVISLHVGLYAMAVIAPFVWGTSRIFRKPLIIRRFGGINHRDLNGLSFKLVDWVVRRADLYLVQTKALVQAGKDMGIDRIGWFPTHRPLVEKIELPSSDGDCRRFIFLGHIREAKGIFEIIEAGERMADDVQVDIYGPFYSGLDESIFSDCEKVRYCGVLNPEKVINVLRTYDALLLPTCWEGEGYPGVILEAFSVGLPVISTMWKEIPEIVDDDCGLLIPVKNAEALYQAMNEIVMNRSLYNKLRKGALKRRELFDLEFWTDRFVTYCRDVINRSLRSWDVGEK